MVVLVSTCYCASDASNQSVCVVHNSSSKSLKCLVFLIIPTWQGKFELKWNEWMKWRDDRSGLNLIKLCLCKSSAARHQQLELRLAWSFFRRIVFPVESRISPHINEPRLIFFYGLFGESISSKERIWSPPQVLPTPINNIKIRDLENSQIPPKHLQVSDFVFILRILNPIFARVERMNWNL